MKHYIYNALAACGCIAALTACDENSWNDNELNGFEVPEITDVQTIEYTLTEANYASIASNSTNKALAGDNQAALKAVGTRFCFSELIPAKDYAPAFFSTTSFPYFTLSNGSYIKLTYNTEVGVPAEVAEIEAAAKYIVSDNEYQEVWGSENDYVAAFAPSHTAEKELPAILSKAYPDAEAGDYVIVNYQTAQTDPVFTAAPEPEEPEFTLSSSLTGAPAKGDDITINGYVVATSTQGPVVADAAGTMFIYSPTNNNDLKIGDQVIINSTVDIYNNGYQTAKGCEPEVSGSREVTYPAPKALTATEIDELAKTTTPIWPIYAKFTGEVAVSGNYINIKLDGTTVQVSPYGVSADTKALFKDKETVTFEGYVIAIASKGKYLNTIITKVGSDAPAATTAAISRAATVASENQNALYTFNGSKWAVAAGAVVLSHADYQAMNQRYDNLSGESPAQFLPAFLKQKFPYAAADDSQFVVYYYYNGSETVTRCDQYNYNGTEWILNNGIVTETAQFVKNNGKWMYDPNVTITLPAGKGIEISTLYYQTCVDWVKANIDQPTGATYVTSYGNNEYYSGTSAYQGNVDLRASSAKSQYPAGYEGLTDEQIVALMKLRFETETMPAALSILHPDADVIPGMDVLYTINFSAYDGTTTSPYVIVYKVVGKGKFEFVECSWNPKEEDK
ncbi:MAG: hypothetical protein K2M52_03910 [Paramuribaculum sp.]|nr:hypothetical protein [Paramuribaculum sp.]